MTHQELQKLQKAAEDETVAYFLERDMELLETIASVMLSNRKIYEVAETFRAFADRLEELV